MSLFLFSSSSSSFSFSSSSSSSCYYYYCYYHYYYYHNDVYKGELKGGHKLSVSKAIAVLKFSILFDSGA